MSTQYIFAADLLSATSQAAVDRYFDDNGDGVADASVVTDMCVKASSAADTKLLKGFSAAAIVLLMQEDLNKMHLAYVALHFAAKRKPEWRDDQGNAPYFVDFNQAMKQFDDLSKGNTRAQQESAAGTHPAIGGNLIMNQPGGPQPTYVFAPDPNNKNPLGSGGY
jgi:hypothetical protein